MKEKKVRRLSPVGIKIAIDNLDQPATLELVNGTPRSRFTTPWFSTKSGYFRITITVVGPKTKEPEGEFPLSGRKAEDILKEITDTIEAFKKEFLGEDTAI